MRHYEMHPSEFALAVPKTITRNLTQTVASATFLFQSLDAWMLISFWVTSQLIRNSFFVFSRAVQVEDKHYSKQLSPLWLQRHLVIAIQNCLYVNHKQIDDKCNFNPGGNILPLGIDMTANPQRKHHVY